MTIKQIYNLAIQMGIKADPRGPERIKYLLKKELKKYQDTKPKDIQEFDQEKLSNPYGDTRIFNATGEEKIKTILAGIDIETGEVLLADRLKSQNQKIDLILSHHPLGRALADLDSVMHLQADLLEKYGVPINISESLMEKRIGEVSRNIAAINHYQAIDAAKLLNFPIMCIHTPVDNLVYRFIEQVISKGKPETVEDLIEVLKSIPEYQQAIMNGAGPRIFAGKPWRRCGKIAAVGLTGGTEGAKDIYEKLSQAGIGTIVTMHIKEENRGEAEKHHLNVVIAGHIASDSLGFNLFLDQLEGKGVKIISTSGLIRVRRSNNG